MNLILYYFFVTIIILGIFYPIIENFEAYRYRLADMIQHKNHSDNKKWGFDYHKKKYPNSIATEYMKNTHDKSDYSLLLDIISKRKPRHQYKDHVVIHLRLGDVIDNSKYPVDQFLNKTTYYYHDKQLKTNYVKTIKYYQNVIDKLRKLGINKAVFITGFHQGTNHTRSLDYLSKLKLYFRSQGFQCTSRIDLDPDDDFLIMCNSKYFVPSGGGFSNLITNIVKKKGGVIITDMD